MLSKPKQQTVKEIITLLTVEMQQAYEEGVRTTVRSFDRLVVWLAMELVDRGTLQRWAKAEQAMLLRAHPFLGPVEEPAETRRVKVFEVEYNYFEPGTLVTPTSMRSVLEDGQVYTITKCCHPRYADGRASCFVEGRETGLSTEYLREVQPGENLEHE
jgi:hypothetical protein